MIYKLLAVAAIAGALFAGGYFRGQAVGRVELAEAKAAWQVEYQKQVDHTKLINSAREKLVQEIENDLKPKLDAATADGLSLAARLREHSRRRVCTVPSPSSSPALPDPASGESGDSEGAGSAVDAALEAHLGACARDSERLSQWQAFYEGLRQAQ